MIKKYGVLFGSIAAVVSSPAVGQITASASQSRDNPQEQAADALPANIIIVTAQKRKQSLIDVPASVSVLGGAELERRNADTLDDVQYSVPGLSITEFAPGTQRLQLRGVSVFGGLPTVGAYIDELPVNTEANQQGQDVRFLDINRVEVLRGPQGTLYGQGSVGGTVRYVTNPVDFDDLALMAMSEIGFIKGGGVDWSMNGVANLPIGDGDAGIRIAARYEEFGGWIDSPALGQENVNQGDALTIRAKFAANLSDRTTFNFTLQHQTLDLGAQNVSNDARQTVFVIPTPQSNNTTFGNIILEHDFGSFSLVSSTGYLDRNASGVTDFSAFLIPALEAPPPFGFGFPAGSFNSVGITELADNEIFTQEIRLASSGDTRFGWTVGAFYRDSRSSTNTFTSVDPDIVPITLIEINGTGPVDSESWAVFGEVSYKLADNVTALVGLRYFEDKRTQYLESVTFGQLAVDQNSATFDDISPRFNLSWRASPEFTLYANVAKGFRSGGFNNTSAGLGIFTVPPTFEPDILWNYELGGRYQSFDGALLAEVAVYRNEWSDVQSQAFLPNSPIIITVNGSEIAGWGAEMAASYEFFEGLRVGVTGGWNDMTYQNTTVEHNAGDPADYVPQFTASAFLDYRFSVGQSDSFVRIDYQYSDAFQLFLRNTQPTPAFSDRQSVLNATVGATVGNIDLSIFAKNISNDDAIVYPAVGALPIPSRRQPRVIGASARISF